MVAVLLAGNFSTIKVNVFVWVTAPLVIVAVNVIVAFPSAKAGLVIV